MAFTESTSDLIPVICRAPLVAFLVVYQISRSVYILLIFISRKSKILKLVCVRKASKKITRFVPLRVHLLEIHRPWQLEYIAQAKIQHFFLLVGFPPRHFFIFVVIMQCISVDFTSCGFVRLATYERRVPDFIALFAFNLLSNAR